MHENETVEMAATTADKQARPWVAALLLMMLATAPAAAAELRPGVVSDDPVWTDKPVRIDRRKQTYERLAVARITIPLRIRPGSRAIFLDSTSFRDNGRLYLLTDAIAVDAKRFCRSATGTVAVCGQQARIALRRLIANRTLSCNEDFRVGSASFLTCTVGGKDIAETLVARGAAWAATPRLMPVQQEAMKQQAGIWVDAQCRSLGRCPPIRRR